LSGVKNILLLPKSKKPRNDCEEMNTIRFFKKGRNAEANPNT
jgi:hypothetical protein